MWSYDPSSSSSSLSRLELSDTHVYDTGNAGSWLREITCSWLRDRIGNAQPEHQVKRTKGQENDLIRKLIELKRTNQ